MSDVANIRIRPMLVTLGEDISQVQAITCTPDISGDHAGDYFIAHEPSGAGHYFWLDDSVATDPAPAGSWTGHAVTYVHGDSGTALATKIAAVANGLTGKFTASASGKVITLTCTAKGYAQPARDAIGAKTTGFAFKVTTLGFLKSDAGNINGEIEVAGFSVTKQEIKTHAGGATILGEAISGYNKPTLKFSFYDTDKTHLRRAFILAGSRSLTPEGADATELLGYGPVNIGGQNPRIRINLHPCDLDPSDKSEDWTIWAASADLDSIKFSGENFMDIPVTINIYPDTTKPKDIQFLAIGDVGASGY